MAEGTKKLTKEERKALHEAKVAARIAEFIRTHFILKCKFGKVEQEFTINPTYLTDLDVIVLPSLDGNGIVYACDVKGSLTFKEVSKYSKSSKKNALGNCLVSKTRNTVIGMLNDATAGMNFEDFKKAMKQCKLYKERDSRKVEKENIVK